METKGHMRRNRVLAIWIGLLAVSLMTTAGASASPLKANTGSIQSLTAQGAAQPGDPIDIASTVQATDRINNSNLYYELSDPSGAVIDTRQIDPGRMSAGQTVSDAWQHTNPPSTGTYTVTLCWSTGNSHNCDIDFKSTQFSSVPTLGWPLSAAAFGMLGIWIWRRREVWSR
jgi:hypothetical protein